MTGIFLLLVAVLWLIAAFFVAKFTSTLLPKTWWAYLLCVVLFLALLPLPLVDEIVGKRQFERLCSENATIQVDRGKAVGKTVYLAIPQDAEVSGTWVHIVLKPWRFVDVTNRETVVSYNTLRAGGGILIRTLGLSEGGVPLTFRGSCEPGGVVDSVKLLKELGVTFNERSAPNSKEHK